MVCGGIGLGRGVSRSVVRICRGFGVGAVRVAAVRGVLREGRWPSTSGF